MGLELGILAVVAVSSLLGSAVGGFIATWALNRGQVRVAAFERMMKTAPALLQSASALCINVVDAIRVLKLTNK